MNVILKEQLRLSSAPSHFFIGWCESIIKNKSGLHKSAEDQIAELKKAFDEYDEFWKEQTTNAGK